MNLPPWATHVAVDASGEVCAYDTHPVWTDAYGGTWMPRQRMGRSEFVEQLGSVSPALARMLCAAVPPMPQNAPEPPVIDT